MQHMLRLAILIFLTTPIIWDYKVNTQVRMLQAMVALFSIYPTGIVGFYALKASSSKDSHFLGRCIFFTFLKAVHQHFNA